MTKAKQRVITQEIVLAKMTPGSRYSIHEIAKLVGSGVPTIRRALADGLIRGSLRRKIEGRRDLYWVPTADDFTRDPGTQRRLSQRTLQGYDEAHRRFREVCMVTRAPQPGSPNRNNDREPQD